MTSFSFVWFPFSHLNHNPKPGEFYQNISFKVGNGNEVRFWEDNWVGKNSLEVLFPSLFRISSLKSRPISEFWEQSSQQMGSSTSWHFHFSRIGQEIIQLQELLQRLERQHPCNEVEDRRNWLADSSSIFVQVSFCLVKKG